jgi:peptidoglycan/xylan/chitin deacetylase (PgdA/CDA1 family)
MPNDTTTFLMYHELRVPGRPLCSTEPGYARYVIDADAFREQMALLVERGFAGLGVSAWIDGATASRKSVVLTFDDGCETDLLVAAPILRELGLTATCYITVDYLGTRGYLTEPQLRTLAATGIEIGCHSMSHPYLSDVDDRRLEYEVVTAKDRLEQLCERPVRSFSCPGGRYDRRLLPIAVSAGYDSVVTSQPVGNRRAMKFGMLGRVAVMTGATPAGVVALAEGHGLRSLRIRGAALALAKSVLGNSLYERVRGRSLR